MHTPTILVLVGITGDLSRRKLLPAIEALKEKNLLPEQFEVVGITRYANDKGYVVMDLDNTDDYQRLAEHLNTIEKGWGVSAQRLFYLSVAPTVAPSIIRHLGISGLSAHAKLLLEKPFAIDVDAAFSETQVYRIDHYLAKTSVRSLPTINFHSVASVSVTATETIGIEGRAVFYEQTGALRDVLQSHLLEVVAAVISPENRLQALKGFSATKNVQRGQYKGYREMVENSHSVVETFVSAQLLSDSALFKGEVILTTGKALDRKHTDLSVVYNDGATQVFSLHDTDNAYEQVFLEAIQGKKEHFISREEVLETLRIAQPIEERWVHSSADLFLYEQGANPKQLLDDRRIL